jgi:hypothetical protein
MKPGTDKPHISKVNRLTLIGFFLIVMLCFTADAYSQIVRGRIDHQGPKGLYTASNVMVTIGLRTGWRSLPAYTGVDGMYYFYNVQPGDYILEIWGPGNKLIQGYSIRVLNQPYTDIRAIVIP